MPAINIADIQIVLQTVQTTQPALKFMDSSGNLYYAEAHLGACADSLVVGDGDASWTQSENQHWFMRQQNLTRVKR